MIGPPAGCPTQSRFSNESGFGDHGGGWPGQAIRVVEITLNMGCPVLACFWLGRGSWRYRDLYLRHTFGGWPGSRGVRDRGFRVIHSFGIRCIQRHVPGFGNARRNFLVLTQKGWARAAQFRFVLRSASIFRFGANSPTPESTRAYVLGSGVVAWPAITTLPERSTVWPSV